MTTTRAALGTARGKHAIHAPSMTMYARKTRVTKSGSTTPTRPATHREVMVRRHGTFAASCAAEHALEGGRDGGGMRAFVWGRLGNCSTARRRARTRGDANGRSDHKISRVRYQSLFSRELSSAALLASRTPEELGAAAEGACDCAFPADAVGAILCALTAA